MEQQRMTGTITQVRLNRGFAFVRGVEDGQSRFIYSRDVVPVSSFDTLYEGRKVTFEPSGNLDMTPGSKNNGLRAVNVKVC
jgi:cold shock CspA family protein